ncbi:hypothetical protein D9758_011831 [Tetrapyrgos nigripes]|uniref:Uncharacterized protein n=1 Tax=Tetrapyrgos nigripes TaxID=182062 RepID=A0A8H5CM84_9AGAR|nr:hypothetical protein D9758_011831 [Tetrapyrgos nigripes]
MFLGQQANNPVKGTCLLEHQLHCPGNLLIPSHIEFPSPVMPRYSFRNIEFALGQCQQQLNKENRRKEISDGINHRIKNGEMQEKDRSISGEI